MLQTLTTQFNGRATWPPVVPAAKYPLVMLITGGYQVDLGPRRAPRFHLVLKDRTCNCGAPNCQGVCAVKTYLQAGGLPAPEGRTLKHITFERCPICAGQTRAVDERWECFNSHAHYFEYRVIRLRAARERWLNQLLADRAAYQAEVATAFSSNEAREAFVQVHRTPYNVDA